MFVLTILEKTKETRLKYCQGTVTVFKKMENCKDANVELASIQLKKLKSAVKYNTRKTLRINRKLFVTTTQKKKDVNTMLTPCQYNKKLSKSQLT